MKTFLTHWPWSHFGWGFLIALLVLFVLALYYETNALDANDWSFNFWWVTGTALPFVVWEFGWWLYQPSLYNHYDVAQIVAALWPVTLMLLFKTVLYRLDQ